ncbi:MAG: hypothetical protein DRP56_00865 [Planctomycetota bacterium]|nr:MAG: hypothetical protein DRP56_00865 [Planctomycetota bacterium]
MSRSQEAAKKKIVYIGVAVCNVCGLKKKDVVEVKKNWFSSIRICDSCCHYQFLTYKSDVGGVAE